MNRLGIEIRPFHYETGLLREIQLLIDGRSLVDRLRDYEEPFARGESHRSLAGAYAGLQAEYTAKAHFLGADADEDGRTCLLICTCGEAGCWPMLARITLDADTVTWSDFLQPHRCEDSVAGQWDYSAFGPFQFEREQYELELAKIGKSPKQTNGCNTGYQ